MLLPRDIVRFADDCGSSDHRVVWATPDEVVLFALGAPGISVRRHARAEVEAMLAERRASLLLDHDYDASPGGALSDAQRRRRDALVGVVEPLLAMAPAIFDARERGRAVAGVERARVCSAKTVHKALERYWRRGMSPNALVPDFNACGKGGRTPGARKFGRPADPGKPRGVNVTPEIAALFDKGLRRFYVSSRRNALKTAYDLTISTFFMDEVEDPATGRIRPRLKPEYAVAGPPTIRQFRYWYSKRDDLLEIRRKRIGDAKYEKDNRPVTGTAVSHLFGVGSRFEIDSTPLDLGAVSAVDRRVYVGRPTFYQVTDVLTKLVCGIYVGVEEASWLAAGLAVRNVVEDKVAFASRFGVDIERHEWPCEGVMPRRILADRGEFKGDRASAFNAKSDVTIEVAAPYRGDLKGTTEKKFDQFHVLLRSILDGIVKKNHGERGEPDYRLEAVLTIEEITRAVIEAVVLLNARKLVDYPRSRAMIADGVSAVPREMWAWAIGKGLTELSRANVSHAEFALLPVGRATVDKDGFVFERLRYEGADPRENVFAVARQRGVSKVAVSYDLTSTTNIYLHDEDAPGGYRVLALTSRSMPYADIAFEDAKALMAADDADTARRKLAEAEAHATFARSAQDVNRRAKAQRGGRIAPRDLANSKVAKRDERDRERSGRQRSAAGTATGNVIRFEPPVPTAPPDADPLRRGSLKEFLS